jgi:glycosyltransferase involved in cell wall biosynthesis
MSKIEFIIPTYERTNHLMCLLNSLCAQTSRNWIAHVIADCPPKDVLNSLEKIIKYFENEERIKFTILDKRYNDWGHTPRNICLKSATEKWVVMTGEDNYYTPKFVELFLEAADKNPNTTFVYCDMVHNWLKHEYIHIKSKIEYGRMDIGNFMSRTKFSKEIQIDTSVADSDWKFVAEYVTSFGVNLIYIPRTLYVHN